MRASSRSQPNESHRDELTPVASFVALAASELGLDGRACDQRTRRLIERLVRWGTSEGLPLERDLLFDPDTVERFVKVGLAGDRSRATYRSILRSVGPRLTTRAPWEPKPEVIARRNLATPYTASDIAELHRDARFQSTARKRRAAEALLALGLGAGLDGRWVTKVRAEDVGERHGAVIVRVGEPCSRDVVIRAPYEETIRELAASAGQEYLIGGHSTSNNRAGHVVASFLVPTGHPRIAPSRLRSTWLLDHLSSGTRLPELCRAAGVASPAVLAELLSEVTPLDMAAEAAMLRGSSS